MSVSITSFAKARMTPDEMAEVYVTSRERRLLHVSIMWSARDRAYDAVVTADGRSTSAQDPRPVEAFRRALTRHDGPDLIVSLLS